jgi:cell division septation protein DedD
MHNQRGGIIYKLFVIPAGVVVIIAVFTVGYYVGRDEGRKTASNEKPPALPEVVSQYLPKKEEFTFYKTLTDKGEKTVSIELKTKPKDESTPLKKENDTHAGEAKSRQPETVQSTEPKSEKSAAQPAKQQTAKPQPQLARKEPPEAKQAPSKLRYTIQVGSYSEKAMAEEEMKNMKKRGYAAFLVATDIPEKGMWYRVRVGSFANKQSAEKLAKELKSKEGIEGFITTE